LTGYYLWTDWLITLTDLQNFKAFTTLIPCYYTPPTQEPAIYLNLLALLWDTVMDDIIKQYEKNMLINATPSPPGGHFKCIVLPMDYELGYELANSAE
jgi:hypothetical protein